MNYTEYQAVKARIEAATTRLGYVDALSLLPHTSTIGGHVIDFAQFGHFGEAASGQFLGQCHASIGYIVPMDPVTALLELMDAVTTGFTLTATNGSWVVSYDGLRLVGAGLDRTLLLAAAAFGWVEAQKNLITSSSPVTPNSQEVER